MSSSSLSATTSFGQIVSHPRLTSTDSASIRTFLAAYDQYVNEVNERAKQLSKDDKVLESVRPVNIKFCIDMEWLKSAIALEFIDDVDDYDKLDEKTLRKYLDDKAEESKTSVNMESLDKIVQRELKNEHAWHERDVSRTKTLFISNHSILARNGLRWILKDN